MQDHPNTDETPAERRLRYARDYYYKKLASMSTDEVQAWRDKKRAYLQDYYRKRLARSTPEEIQAIQQKARTRSHNLSKTQLEQRRHTSQRSRQRHEEQRREDCRKWRAQNQERIAEYNRRWRTENPDRAIELGLAWRKNNRERRNSQLRNRFATDAAYKLRVILGCRIYTVLRRRQLSGRKSDSTINLIGCSVDFLMAHLEARFAEGMTWENYGSWHVDHIRPCASFDLLDPEQQRMCFHYSNLQPLWAKDNLRKSAKFN